MLVEKLSILIKPGFSRGVEKILQACHISQVRTQQQKRVIGVLNAAGILSHVRSVVADADSTFARVRNHHIKRQSPKT